MMKRICYLFYYNKTNRDDNIGVKKKIDGQIKELRNAGFDVTLMLLEDCNKLIRALPFQTSTFSWMTIKDDLCEFDAIYLRYCFCDFQLLRLCKYVKKHSDAKIIIEIPTFPYDSGVKIKKIKEFIIFNRDRIYRNYLKNHIDRVTVLSDDEYVFGIKTLKIRNGIDLEIYRPIFSDQKKNILSICIVSSVFVPVQGLDRMIEGLWEYYSNGGEREILIYIVGRIPEDLYIFIKYYINSPILQNRIILSGILDFSKLSDVYNSCDLAIASLGGHRRGKDEVSCSLKTREYMAYGIPFVYSGRIDAFEGKDIDFSIEGPDDESPIDFFSILKSYDRMVNTYTYIGLRKRIREFAEDNISLKNSLLNVTNYLNY